MSRNRPILPPDLIKENALQAVFVGGHCQLVLEISSQVGELDANKGKPSRHEENRQQLHLPPLVLNGQGPEDELPKPLVLMGLVDLEESLFVLSLWGPLDFHYKIYLHHVHPPLGLADKDGSKDKFTLSQTGAFEALNSELANSFKYGAGGLVIVPLDQITALHKECRILEPKTGAEDQGAKTRWTLSIPGEEARPHFYYHWLNLDLTVWKNEDQTETGDDDLEENGGANADAGGKGKEAPSKKGHDRDSGGAEAKPPMMLMAVGVGAVSAVADPGCRADHGNLDLETDNPRASSEGRSLPLSKGPAAAAPKAPPAVDLTSKVTFEDLGLELMRQSFLARLKVEASSRRSEPI